MSVEEQVVDERLSEGQRVVAWRLLSLLDAGYPLALAQIISTRVSGLSKVDLHEACELVRRGCPPETAAEILL